MKVSDAHRAPLQIESFDQLTALVEKPMLCRFKIDEQEIALPVHRLSPDIEEALAKIENEVTPSWVPPQPAKPGVAAKEGYYDHTSAEYLAKKERSERTVRAMRIYFGCPVVAGKKPGLVNREEILKFIQGDPTTGAKGILTDTILEVINLTIMAGGLEVAERANFTTARE